MPGYRIGTLRDRAPKPLSVPFTHGTGSVANRGHTAAEARAGTATRAWNVVALDRFGTAYVNVPFAFAETTAIRLSTARPTAP